MQFLSNFHHQITGPTEASQNEPRLVFLHGVMGFAANWRSIAKAFESRYRVLVYDQRGHGRSMKPATGYDPKDYAEDLRRIIDELKWNKIHLVGHSMGGRNALQFAADHPERVEKLVIEDIGPMMNDAGYSYIWRILDEVPVPFPDKRAAKEFFDTRFLDLFKDNPRRVGLAAYLYANITEDEQKRAVWRFSEAGVRESIERGHAEERWDEVRRLKMPTLVIRGESSRDLSPETFRRMLRENPRVRGVEIPGAGHWVHSDQPELFITALREFFENPD